MRIAEARDGRGAVTAGRRSKVITPEAAVRLIFDGDTLAVGGFVGIGVPEQLLVALSERFETSGSPRGLTLVFAAGQGDAAQRGLNRIARVGLIRRVIGSHFGFVPALGALMLDEQIEAYCLPMGVISHLYRETAAGRPGAITRVGLGTFVDPRMGGIRMNDSSRDEVVRLVEVGGEEHLFYPGRPIDVAFLRGTTADEHGNVTMEREAATLDALSIAQAAKNSAASCSCRSSRWPPVTGWRPARSASRASSSMAWSSTVAAPCTCRRTTSSTTPPTPARCASAQERPAPTSLDARKAIARRAAMALHINAVVNLGVGVPESIATVAHEEGILDRITLTVEAGAIGGVPAGGLSFGAATNAHAVIDQPYQSTSTTARGSIRRSSGWRRPTATATSMSAASAAGSRAPAGSSTSASPPSACTSSGRSRPAPTLWSATAACRSAATAQSGSSSSRSGRSPSAATTPVERAGRCST